MLSTACAMSEGVNVAFPCSLKAGTHYAAAALRAPSFSWGRSRRSEFVPGPFFRPGDPDLAHWLFTISMCCARRRPTHRPTMPPRGPRFALSLSEWPRPGPERILSAAFDASYGYPIEQGVPGNGVRISRVQREAMGRDVACYCDDRRRLARRGQHHGRREERPVEIDGEVPGVAVLAAGTHRIGRTRKDVPEIVFRVLLGTMIDPHLRRLLARGGGGITQGEGGGIETGASGKGIDVGGENGNPGGSQPGRPLPLIRHRHDRRIAVSLNVQIVFGEQQYPRGRGIERRAEPDPRPAVAIQKIPE